MAFQKDKCVLLLGGLVNHARGAMMLEMVVTELRTYQSKSISGSNLSPVQSIDHACMSLGPI